MMRELLKARIASLLSVVRPNRSPRVQPTGPVLSMVDASLLGSALVQSWREVWQEALTTSAVMEKSDAGLSPLTARAEDAAVEPFRVRWNGIGLAAYIAAVGIAHPTLGEGLAIEHHGAVVAAEVSASATALSPDELKIVTRVAGEDFEPLWAEFRTMIAQADAAAGRHLALVGSVRPEQHARLVATISMDLPPQLNTRQLFDALIERSNAEATKALDPLARFTELQDLTRRDLRYQVNQLLANKIDAAEFRARVLGTLEGNYREAWRVGKVRAGGGYWLSDSEIDRIRDLITDENRYLTGWIADVHGKYTELEATALEQRMQWRSDLYAKALRGVFHEGWAAQLPDDEEGIWLLGIAEHCDTCIAEAAKGWRAISSFTRWPGDGSTDCVTQCKCSVASRNHGTSLEVETTQEGDDNE